MPFDRNSYLRLNPCGVEKRPSTYCRYVEECTEFSQSRNGFICLSKMSYQVAEYLLKGSDSETETKDMAVFLRDNSGQLIVDPTLPSWQPKKLTSRDLEKTAAEIVSRGIKISGQVRIRKDPLDFHCPVEEIVADLRDSLR
jgi:hypothetical protein